MPDGTAGTEYRDVEYEGLTFQTESFVVDGGEATFTFWYGGALFRFTGWLIGEKLVWEDVYPDEKSRFSGRVARIIVSFALGALKDRLQKELEQTS